jgi:Ca2+-transporting ATPase
VRAKASSEHRAETHPRNPLSDATPWHARELADVSAAVGLASPDGLDEAEAARRLASHGPNALREAKGVGPWALLLAQFKGVLIWLLIVAGAVSGLLGEAADAIAIFAIVILNALIGFYQEYNAERSIAALKKLTAPQAKVRRGGRLRAIPATEVVRGDVIEFEAGDLVPADARLASASSLRSAEAALTGESQPVGKTSGVLGQADLPLGDRANMVYMGTSIAGGAGRAVVVATGMETEIGKIAGLIEEAGETESPLQRGLADFGRLLVWISLGIIAILFLLGLLRRMPFLDLFLTSVSLAVAAVPEGLPAVVTIALALGVQRMSRRNALIRKLAAVETLGSAGVICTDKTGTLTLGEMAVREYYAAGKRFQVEGSGWEPGGRIARDGREPSAAERACLERLAWTQVGTVTAALSRSEGRWTVVGDPTEGALLAAAAKLGIAPEGFGAEAKLAEIPFDSDRKRASVVRRLPGAGAHVLVNGAPDLLLPLCTRVLTEAGPVPLDAAWRERIAAANAEMAGRALRVLGSAYKGWNGDRKAEREPPEGPPAAEALESDLIFAGLAGMLDPPRPEAARAIALCREAGIRVVMITGDHPGTARAVAAELGLSSAGDAVLTGAELERMDEAALGERVERIAVYARVSAEHKLRIVRAWRARGAVVAMTGDGVNDAPALKGADIGVAMGRTGTEVTKQASDMVITDDNFASIVAAVEEGRGVYANIRKTLNYLLAGNSGELLLMLTAVVAGLPSPLLPIHLLWINLVTDGLPALCLAAEPVEPEVMRRRPRPRNERLANGPFLRNLSFIGILTAGVSIGVFLFSLKRSDLAEARSNAFAALVFCELFRALGARSDTRPFWRINPFGNVRLLAVVALSIGFQIFSHHNAVLGRLLKTRPLDLAACLSVLGVSLIPFAVLEAAKAFRRSGAGARSGARSETR